MLPDMAQQIDTSADRSFVQSPAWSAVSSLALCVAVLIASEFMPVSLLTPIATDLQITAGQTGQVISISGFFAVVTSLFVSGLTRRIDRRLVICGFSALLIGSGTIVSIAPNYEILMLGRAMLGLAIGGFWSMSTAIVMRLVPTGQVSKGLAILNAGNAIAATISAPLGSMLGSCLGWRGAFFFVVPVAVLALIWQTISLPSLPSQNSEGSANVFVLLRRPQVRLGMASIALLFMGQFALFTYLRPFLEGVLGLSISMLSLMLLLMGVAGVIGTYVISRLLRTRLFGIVIAIPLVMAAIALALIVSTGVPLVVAILLIGWGLFGTAAPVGWGTWLSKVMPDDAEAGGGLQVAVIQLAITIGAAAGGVLFDAMGWWSPFALSALLLVGSSIAAVAARTNWERSQRSEKEVAAVTASNPCACAANSRVEPVK